MLIDVCTPAKGRGRPRIVGTVVRDESGEMILVRRIYSLGENAGNTGSPRSESWVAMRRDGLAPVIVRGAPGRWHIAGHLDFGEIWVSELAASLIACGYTIADVWPGSQSPTWPVSVWDRRIVLPDDDRWPKEAKSLAKYIKDLLRDRNECPDAEVWRIDARIIAASPK